MSRSFTIAYFAHSVRSDWNNGNAHFLRGLLRALCQLGHHVVIIEPEDGWSIQNLHSEPGADGSLNQFFLNYPDLTIRTYKASEVTNTAHLRIILREYEFVIVHEWNAPALADALLRLRDQLQFKLLFHDTHHRASSSPELIRLFRIAEFDGVLAFGEALRSIYRGHFGLERVWTLHEAADTTIFKPCPGTRITADLVWIGNWGDDERSAEIIRFLLQPASILPHRQVRIYGVRYPLPGLEALRSAGVIYGGYLPNLDAPATYAAARLTVHIPRQQYTGAMHGIPTIRVFEALACGIPLISAPWHDSEFLFREGDFRTANNTEEMQLAMESLLDDPKAAAAQAARGLETVLARHTCFHRAQQLTAILEENFA